MNSKLQKVAVMIKKTFHTKDQIDCFDGCIMYVEEQCTGLRNECVKGMESKFTEIQKSLITINGKLDKAIGNGNGEH